jgi:hypothetical protein
LWNNEVDARIFLKGKVEQPTGFCGIY